MDPLISSAADQLFSKAAPPEAVREVLNGQAGDAMWAEIEASGFLDGLVPEQLGGSGLSATDVFPVLFACGKYAVPAPVGETMFARAALALAGCECVPGPVALGVRSGSKHGGFASFDVPHGRVAAWVLVSGEDGTVVLPTDGATFRGPGSDSLSLDLRWDSCTDDAVELPLDADWLVAGARIESAAMAGAMESILASSVRYAGERVQFGRPIGRFQAVQQQVSILTEQVFASRMAAELAFSSPRAQAAVDLLAGADRPRVAAAKTRIGEAAILAAAIAHGVHGAIGITEEFDLQLHTGRLQSGRLRFGSEAYWARELGRNVLTHGGARVVDFLREELTSSRGASP
jgi:acyl-CoA dehydrogenase